MVHVAAAVMLNGTIAVGGGEGEKTTLFDERRQWLHPTYRCSLTRHTVVPDWQAV